MVNKCNVFGCFTNFPKHDPGVVCGLPKEEELRERWLKFINRSDLDKNSSYIFVCQKHFEPRFLNRGGERVRLIKKLNPVPTIYPDGRQKETPSLQKSLPSFRRSPKVRVFQEDQLNKFQKEDEIDGFSDVNDSLLKYIGSDYSCARYEDHAVFYKLEENELSIPEVTACIRIDANLHVKLFHRGSPIPLPKWFSQH